MKLEIKETLTDMLNLIREVYIEVEKLKERIEKLEREKWILSLLKNNLR